MTILELNQPIWFDTPKGIGICHFMIDRGPQTDTEWICFIADTGECWTFTNIDIKLAKNQTLGIRQEKNKPSLCNYCRLYKNYGECPYLQCPNKDCKPEIIITVKDNFGEYPYKEWVKRNAK